MRVHRVHHRVDQVDVFVRVILRRRTAFHRRVVLRLGQDHDPAVDTLHLGRGHLRARRLQKLVGQREIARIRAARIDAGFEEIVARHRGDGRVAFLQRLYIGVIDPAVARALRVLAIREELFLSGQLARHRVLAVEIPGRLALLLRVPLGQRAGEAVLLGQGISCLRVVAVDVVEPLLQARLVALVGVQAIRRAGVAAVDAAHGVHPVHLRAGKTVLAGQLVGRFALGALQAGQPVGQGALVAVFQSQLKGVQTVFAVLAARARVALVSLITLLAGVAFVTLLSSVAFIAFVALFTGIAFVAFLALGAGVAGIAFVPLLSLVALVSLFTLLALGVLRAVGTVRIRVVLVRAVRVSARIVLVATVVGVRAVLVGVVVACLVAVAVVAAAVVAAAIVVVVAAAFGVVGAVVRVAAVVGPVALVVRAAVLVRAIAFRDGLGRVRVRVFSLRLVLPREQQHDWRRVDALDAGALARLQRATHGVVHHRPHLRGRRIWREGIRHHPVAIWRDADSRARDRGPIPLRAPVTLVHRVLQLVGGEELPPAPVVCGQLPLHRHAGRAVAVLLVRRLPHAHGRRRRGDVFQYVVQQRHGHRVSVALLGHLYVATRKRPAKPIGLKRPVRVGVVGHQRHLVHVVDGGRIARAFRLCVATRIPIRLLLAEVEARFHNLEPALHGQIARKPVHRLPMVFCGRRARNRD